MQALFEASNSAIVGAWGLIIGVVGLLLTVAGFGISLIQIHRAKSAANEARDAVAAVQVRISRYDAAVDLAEAKTSFQNARHYADLDAWPQFVTSYETASEALNRVILQSIVTDAKIVESLKKSRLRIAKTCNSVEKFLESAGPVPIKSNINKAIRSELSVVQEAEQHNWKGAIS